MKFTQWFSCTTPPAHEGEYEFRFVRKGSPVYRVMYSKKSWTRSRYGYLLDAIVNCPEAYEWRGLAVKPKRG